MAKLMPGSKLMQMQYTEISGLSEKMVAALGDVEDTFTCLIWGMSGNGKTSFALQLLKELQETCGNVLYLGYEEGHGKSFRDAVKRSGVDPDKLQILDDATYAELEKRLKRKKSPKIVVVDSFQYSRFTYEEYKQLKRQFVFGRTPSRRKIFLFISHSVGTRPKGAAATEVMYDVNIKIRVEGFIAFVESRFSNKWNYSIEEGRGKAYWGEDYEHKLYKKRKTVKRAQTRKPKAETTTAIA